ncbi:MAG: DUF305 domain-containing protein [Aridibacter famidurans]|nr:DUF305 domain-containing protein [Aridibacter famidurans]
MKNKIIRSRPITFIVGIGTAAVLTAALSASVSAQQVEPVVVQPGAPGQETRKLSADTTGVLPPSSKKDVEFMQGMIVHHAQAVEMVALMADRTDNKELLLLGARISHTQAEEIGFMKRWLESRGEKSSMGGMDMKGEDHAGHHMPDKKMDMSDHQMPGMLTPKQMEELAAAKGTEFDRLFLTGMIQHHIGALVMVRDLFGSAGAGQDAQLFNFATDVDSGQRAEIRVMQKMLGELPKEND